ncbi:MAG: mechanosensitive ion channel [Chloroflexota bacterium]
MGEVILQQIGQLLGGSIPSIVAALLILIIGWLIALAVSSLVRAALRRTNLDDRLARWVASEEKVEGVKTEQWVGKGVFYLIMIFVLIAFFQTLGLTLITQPLNQLLSQIFDYVPRLLGAGLLLALAWILASGLKLLVSRLLRATNLDERLSSEAGMEEEVSLADTLANAVYWLVFLLFLPAVLDALALQGLLAPVQDMLDQLLGYLPNLFGAALIVAVGWFVARIVQRIVTNLLAAIGADRLSERIGISRVLGEQTLSGAIGLVIYVLILIPVLIAALDALALEAVTGPATNMLDTILAALPALLAAGLVLIIAYVVGRVVGGLIANLLAGLGFNRILARLGLGHEPAEGQRTPAEFVGYLVLVGIMLFATIEAFSLLGFEQIASMVSQFTIFAGQVVLGVIIFGIGIYLAKLASGIVRETDLAQAGLLAAVTRGAILAFAGAMALRQMGLANEIVNLAFGLVLGAIAVAAALAFGLGGREVAARQLEQWVPSESEPPHTGRDVGR